MSNKKLKVLKAKVKSLKGSISTNDQRIIAASSGVHFNTIRNYLYGFGSDERIMKDILSYASKMPVE